MLPDTSGQTYLTYRIYTSNVSSVAHQVVDVFELRVAIRMRTKKANYSNIQDNYASL